MTVETSDIVRTLHNKTFILIDGNPFRRANLNSWNEDGFEVGSTTATPSNGKIKIFFRLLSMACPANNKDNPHIILDPKSIQSVKEVDHSLGNIGKALVESIIDELSKSKLFKEFDLERAIQELNPKDEEGSKYRFTLLRIKTDGENVVGYKIAVLKLPKNKIKYQHVNILELKLRKDSEEIIIEINRDKSADSDPISIKSIMDKLLLLLEANGYIDSHRFGEYNVPGEWSFDNYKN